MGSPKNNKVLEQEMRDLRDDPTLAGGSFLVNLHHLGMSIFSSTRHKEAYWALFFLCIVFFRFSAAFAVLIAGALATLASYKKPSRPKGIPLASMDLDVLLGRPIQASKDIDALPS